MKGDFTRVTFDPLRHFSRVLMQQGRVQLDADFNEQSAILLHYLRTLVADLVGPYGGPRGGEAGFNLVPQGNGRFTVGVGHYYVDGILVENHDPTAELRIEGGEGAYVAYLDVWERHVTHLQVPAIREVALGGPDTCTRAEVVWAVRRQEVGVGDDGDVGCEAAQRWVEELRERERPGTRPHLRARVSGEGQGGDACSIPPESRYRGKENQLYRIEVHRGGAPWDGTTDRDGTPQGNLDEAATFVWSRDNGSVVFEIVRQEGPVVHLARLGRDARTALSVGDWVEIMDDALELAGAPGILAQVGSVDTVDIAVTLEAPDGVTPVWPEYDEETTTHPLLRRWDHHRIAGQPMHEGAILLAADDQEWLEIEDGIEVAFHSGQTGFRTGDYWLVPARVATGDIEWPQEADDQPLALPPAGVHHHFAPLAIIQGGSRQDCRCGFRLPCEPMPEEVVRPPVFEDRPSDVVIRPMEDERTERTVRGGKKKEGGESGKKG